MTTSLLKLIITANNQDNLKNRNKPQNEGLPKNHIDECQSKISNTSLKANHEGQKDRQKKGLIGAQAFALPKNEDNHKIKDSLKYKEHPKNKNNHKNKDNPQTGKSSKKEEHLKNIDFPKMKAAPKRTATT